MSAMAEMSMAIRFQLERHGSKLTDIPPDVLDDYVNILGALTADLRDEWKRRVREDAVSRAAREAAGRETLG